MVNEQKKQQCKHELARITAAGVPQRVSGAVRLLAADVDCGHSPANMVQSAIASLREAGVDMAPFADAYCGLR